MDGLRKTAELHPSGIAVVIPCYRTKSAVLDVIARIGPEVARIYCVDDACPEGSGRYIEENCRDPRVAVLYHDKNRGVGGAMITGYKKALAGECGIIVKLDGDGQMDPALLPVIADPVRRGEADYAKGNRFYAIEGLEGMPFARLVGNAILSFFTKLSSGYWTTFDPTNGYTAIHRNVLAKLPLDKIATDYFFECDMLFRLNIARALIADVPMAAHYGDERSNLKITRIVAPFIAGHMRNFCKRILYNYFLRDFNVASIQLIFGIILTAFGLLYGIERWVANASHGVTTPAGTVMFAAAPLFIGVQMIMAFLNYDIQSVPRRIISRDLNAPSV